MLKKTKFAEEVLASNKSDDKMLNIAIKNLYTRLKVLGESLSELNERIDKFKYKPRTNNNANILYIKKKYKVIKNCKNV